jgi:diguanylate cyclase (GGDEF)-like protein
MDSLTAPSRAGSIALVFGGVAAVAALDYLSGTELRVSPLYYAPLTIAAWHFGQRGALAAAALCFIAWVGSNVLAGLRFSSAFIWVANAASQAVSFVVVGLLAAHLKAAIGREQARIRTDPLTGVLNSGAFYDETHRILRLCRRGRRPATLAVLDLDDFKRVNAEHGQRAGDDLLRAVAQVIQSSVRSSDVTARLGADDFAILLPELGADEARQALDRIRARLARPLGGIAKPIGVTVGAAAFKIVPDEAQVMVRIADAVMHAAKQSGKDRVKLEAITSERLPDVSTLYDARDGQIQPV